MCREKFGSRRRRSCDRHSSRAVLALGSVGVRRAPSGDEAFRSGRRLDCAASWRSTSPTTSSSACRRRSTRSALPRVKSAGWTSTSDLRAGTRGPDRACGEIRQATASAWRPCARSRRRRSSTVTSALMQRNEVSGQAAGADPPRHRRRHEPHGRKRAARRSSARRRTPIPRCETITPRCRTAPRSWTAGCLVRSSTRSATATPAACRPRSARWSIRWAAERSITTSGTSDRGPSACSWSGLGEVGTPDAARRTTPGTTARRAAW